MTRKQELSERWRAAYCEGGEHSINGIVEAERAIRREYPDSADSTIDRLWAWAAKQGN